MRGAQGKYIIGLTGNIAVGKSVVRQMLQHLGAYTIDADGLTHQAMAPGAPAYAPIVEMFGKFVLNEDGTINRSILGSIAFSYPEALAKLEAIIHPIVTQAVQTLVMRAKQPVIVIEAIKLLESSLANYVDTIWVVDASPETQLRRLKEKRRMPEDEARKRIVAQRPQADKIARANVIIMNDGSVEDTWRQVQAAWNDVRRAMAAKGITPDGIPATPVIASPRPATAPLRSIGPQTSLTNGPVGVRPITPLLDFHVRRGMPGNAEQIAQFISRVTGQSIGRMEVMLAFGQKSYLLALDKENQLVGLIGWQVENLITRVDEFYLDPEAAREPVIRVLTQAIEEASRELQSEVSFVFLPKSTPPEIVQSFQRAGYTYLKLEEVRFPAWREAARELMREEGVALMKQLRADRVMKPI